MKIIKNKIVKEDDWSVLRLHGGEAADSVVVPPDRVLIPLSVWTCQFDTLKDRDGLGLWIGGFERIEEIPGDIHRFPLIAVDFHKFNDGRGYTLAYRLRRQYGYRGELRAMGDVLQDQLFYLDRVGFDSYAVREDKDPQDVLAGFDTFSVRYQSSVDVRSPLFRREIREVVR